MATPLTIGEICSWSSPASVPFRTLRDSLAANGFDEAMARDMLPRNAFRRAAHELEVGRIIRKTAEDDHEIQFQFTKEGFDQLTKSFNYSFETVLKLSKGSGVVSCSIPELQTAAQALVDAHISKRNANDVTRIVQKIFTKQGDLFPVRKQGGVYFVPAQYSGLADRVEGLMLGINGEMSRFECGGTKAEKNVASAMDDEFRSLIQELTERIAGLDLTSSTQAVVATYQRIELLKAKIAAYKDLLAEHSQTLNLSLTATAHELTAKLSAGPVSVAEPQAVTPDRRTSDADNAEWASLLDDMV